MSFKFPTVRTAMAAIFIATGAIAPVHGEEQGINYIVPAAQESTERKQAPNVVFADGSGMPVQLNRFQGFVLVLNFWSQHCGPCLKQLTYLDRLQATFQGKKLLVLALSVDSNGSAGAKTYFERNRFNQLRPYADPNGNAARALGVTGLPTTIVIDRFGREVGRALGERTWDSEEAIGRLNWLLHQPQ